MLFRSQAGGLDPSKTVWLKISKGKAPEETVSRIRQLLRFYPGKTPVKIYLEESGKVLALTEGFFVNPDRGFVQELEALLGKGSVRSGK